MSSLSSFLNSISQFGATTVQDTGWITSSQFISVPSNAKSAICILVGGGQAGAGQFGAGGKFGGYAGFRLPLLTNQLYVSIGAGGNTIGAYGSPTNIYAALSSSIGALLHTYGGSLYMGSHNSIGTVPNSPYVSSNRVITEVDSSTTVSTPNLIYFSNIFPTAALSGGSSGVAGSNVSARTLNIPGGSISLSAYTGGAAGPGGSTGSGGGSAGILGNGTAGSGTQGGQGGSGGGGGGAGGSSSTFGIGGNGAAFIRFYI